MAGEVVDLDGEDEAAGVEVRRSDGDGRGLRLQEGARAQGGLGEVGRLGRDGEFVAMGVKHAFHDEVGADEGVAMDAVARDAEERGHLDGLVDGRHVALLAGLGFAIAGVQPLEVNHLLGELANLFAAGSEGLGVESVAGAAEAGVANVRGLHRRIAGGGGVHERDVGSVDIVGAVDQTGWLGGAGDDDVADIGGGCAEAVGLDLMADGAGDAVGSGRVVFAIELERKTGEDGCFAVLRFIHQVLHGHVADGALVLDGRGGLGVIEGFAAHASLPVGITRGVGHDAGTPLKADGDVLAFAGLHAVVAGDAAVGGAEHIRRVGLRGLHTGNAGQDEGEGERGGSGCEQGQASSHFHPSQNLPSAQSQRR